MVVEINIDRFNVLSSIGIEGDKSRGVDGLALPGGSRGHSESDMRMSVSCNKSTADGAHAGTGSSLAILFYYPTFTFMLNRFPLIQPFILFNSQRLYFKELGVVIVHVVLLISPCCFGMKSYRCFMSVIRFNHAICYSVFLRIGSTSSGFLSCTSIYLHV